MERFKLGENLLNGTISSDLLNLQQLKHLEIGSNMLSGTIPSELWSLAQLEVLKFGWNLLSATISRDLLNLHQLRHLEIGGNMLSGTIPDLVNMTKLTAVLITDNPLIEGSFPEMSGLSDLGKSSLSYGRAFA